MLAEVSSHTLFVIGANSLVARLMKGVWNGPVPLWCARQSPADAVWDLGDGAEALAHLLEAANVSTVLCLAGATPGAQDFSVNRVMGETVVRAAELAGCTQVLLASTMAVYGAFDGPASETALCAPLGAYGASKLEMERASLGRAGVTALRLGNVVGADMLFRNIAAGQEIVIDQFPDGRTPARSYIDPSHLARTIAALVGRDLPAVLNVAAQPAVSMGGLCDAAGVAWRGRPAPQSALPIAEMDLTRLNSIVGDASVDANDMVAGWRRATQAMT